MSTENLKELRNALSCWQDDYDCDDDKEQYDMFGAAIDAVSRLEAAERANSAQSDHINQQQDRIDSLEQKNAALGNALGTAERERDKLRAIAEEQSKLAGSNAARAQKAEAEIARRDAAAGEPVAWKWRLISIYDSAQIGPWRLCLAPLAPGNGDGCKTEAIPLYTAAPAAVLPPEMFCEKDGEDLLGQAYLAGYNQCRADALALGAQQQRVVELHKRKSTEVISGQRYSYVLLEDLLPELEAAGVKWEVKK